MKRSLTKLSEQTRMMLVGQMEAGSVEVQPARDSQLKATNCRWDGGNTSAIPFYNSQRQFRALKCLRKPNKRVSPKAASLFAEGKKSLKTKSRFVQFTLNQYNRQKGPLRYNFGSFL